MSDPAIRQRLLARLRASGMTPEQIRTRLKDMGYSEDVIRQLTDAASASSDMIALTDDVFAAVRALGVIDSTALDSLRNPVLARRRTRLMADTLLLDSLSVALTNDTLRAAIVRLLASPAARRAGIDSGFQLFGREVFDRRTTQFDPSVNGPLPPNYQIGFGDQFTLVLTGDVERTEELTVTRDGWVVMRDVGQIPAANLTFEQLRATLANRLGRVYSGIGNGTTRFSVLPTRVGTNQIFVLGDVKSPNAYQISRLGTVLTALYAAGGPNATGNARQIDVQRNNRVVATMDLYDYLMSGSSSTDIRLENGDVVFVRPQGPRVRVAGAVVRPATYELKPGESLADAVRMAGGFRPEADQRRVQIERLVPAAERERSGTDKEFLDVTTPRLTERMESGDVVRVFTVELDVSNKIEVRGNVFQPSSVAYEPGMRLSQAFARAGGLKSDTYLGSVLVSRLQPDSTRTMTRVALRPDGTPVNDIELAPRDVIRIASITEFRTPRFVKVGGAVNNPRDIPYHEGMTMRDAIFLARGLKEGALLTEAQLSRWPADRRDGVTAITMKVALDSTYLFERGPDGRYLGPPGIAVPAASAPEVLLQPYDVISILRQPEFEYMRTVSVAGSVKYAGSYTLLSKTERLYDVIKRAGGLASDADSAAIFFLRQRDSVGRVGIDLPRVLKNPKHVDNLILVDRDSIFIAKYNAVVMVRGEVNSPASAVAYVKGADIDFYIRSAGGGSTRAEVSKAFVLQPNGKMETKRRTALMYTSTPNPRPGSVVHVPQKDPNERKRDWLAAVQTSLALLGSLITVAVLIGQQKQQP